MIPYVPQTRRVPGVMQDLECQAEEGRVVPATDGIACGFVRVVYLDGQGNLASRLIAPISHIVAPVISMKSLLPRPSSYPTSIL